MGYLETISAEQEADTTRALSWWKNASEEDKILVWNQIQQESSEPVKEVIARFAQIGFTQILLAAEKK